MIVLVPALALVLSAVVVQSEPKTYRASMGIVVAQAGGPYVSPLGNQPLSQTMTSILQSNVVARTVIEKLHLDITPSTLLKNLNVTLKPQSSVLQVTYDSRSKTGALRVLSEVGKSFETVARERLGVSTSLKKPGPLRIVSNVYDPPHLDPHAVSPRPAKTLGFAAALGLAIGLILAFTRESLDDRIRDAHDAEEWFGAPLVGALPRTSKARPRREVDGAREDGIDGALEVLRVRLQLHSHKIGLAVLVTTAGADSDAANFVANLGTVLARAGEEVICVDADYPEGRLQRLLSNNGRAAGQVEKGLVGVLEGKTELDEALVKISLAQATTNGDADGSVTGHLTLLPVGASGSEPGALPPNRLAGLVPELTARARFVLFDAPRLLSSAPALELLPAVDGVLLVARRGQTRRESAEAVRSALKEVGARNVTVVLTDA